MATSTYSDTSTAIKVGDWILTHAKPGHQYRGDPDDLDNNQRRAYYLWERYRYLVTITQWASQDGQVATGANLKSYSGTVGLQPTGTTGFICSGDDLTAHQLGTDIYRQEQVWEHWGEWATYDVTDLA